MLEGGRKLFKYWNSNGVIIGVADTKSDKNTYLLVIIHVRLFQKIVLDNLMGQTQIKNCI